MPAVLLDEGTVIDSCGPEEEDVSHHSHLLAAQL